MSGNAYIKLFGNDWRSDPRLRLCSAAARGVWIDLITLMMEAEPYGHLLIDGKSPTPDELGAVLATPTKVIRRACEELAARGVYSITDKGVIYSRRMLRDRERQQLGKETGVKGGNPKLRPAPLTPPVNQPLYPDPGNTINHQPEAISQKPSERGAASAPADAETPPNLETRKDTNGHRNPRGTRLAADWQPSTEDREFAQGLGFDFDATEHIGEQFRDYWHAKAGQGATKLDWPATWRNWCRREADNRRNGALGGNHGAGNRQGPASFAAAVRKVIGA